MERPKGVRQAFIANPFLAQVTLRQIVNSPTAMNTFMQRCRQLPHCGETTIKALIALIEAASDSHPEASTR